MAFGKKDGSRAGYKSSGGGRNKNAGGCAANNIASPQKRGYGQGNGKGNGVNRKK